MRTLFIRTLGHPLRVSLFALAVLALPMALAGCGGSEGKEHGTLAPPIQDDYAKVMEDFMKKNPQKK